MKKLFPLCFFVLLASACACHGQASLNQNFISTAIVREAGFLTEASLSSATATQLQTVIRYKDGLGRALQTVQVKSTPGSLDLVTPQTYDALGRPAKQ